MEQQKAKARASWSGSGDTASENIWFPLREKLGATEFLGYETETAEGVVAALVKDGKDVDSLEGRRERRRSFSTRRRFMRSPAARSATPA